MDDLPSTNTDKAKESPTSRRLKELWDRISEDSFVAWLVAWFWKEWIAMKEGWILFLFLWLILGTLQFVTCRELIYEPMLTAKDGQIKTAGDTLSKQSLSDKDELSKSQGATQEAERDRDKYQLMYQNDENTMAPLRQAANEHFFSAPPDKRIDLLIQKLDSLRNEMDEKVVGQPPSTMIFAATADITMTVIKNKQTPGNTMLLGGGVGVGFGNGPNALLIATSQNITSQLVGDNQIQFSVGATAPPNSPYMGKPVSSLKDAKYIEVDLGSFTPSGTVVVGGTVTWVINYTYKVSFDIPPQTTTDSRVVIPNIESGLMPLSSVPDMLASPH